MRFLRIKLILWGFFYTGMILANNTYQVDPKHSHVLWNTSHFGFSNPSGKWMAEGTLEYDPKAPQNSQAKITIPVAKIITGLPDLDKHLKGKDFFDVEQFPQAIFVSDKVTVSGDKITEVSGKLTLHGVTQPVTLKVKQNKIGVNPMNDRPTIGFSANTTLKRSDFNIPTMVPNIGDEVPLQIEVEAYQDKPQ